jgi:uncharacterized protein (DUF2336 family)
VIRLLARDAIPVAREILLRSPALTPLDLLTIIAATGPEHHRLIARRPDLSNDVIRALSMLEDAETIAQLGSRASATPESVPAPPASEHSPVRQRHTFAERRTAARMAGGESAPVHLNAFLAAPREERLRLMAELSALPPRRSYSGAATRLDQTFRSILGAAQIVAFARRSQRRELVTAVAEGLGIEEALVTTCMDDKSGEPFAVMLKALGLDNIQAQQVLLLATPAIGQDVNVFFRLVDLYAAMEPHVAESLVGAWRGDQVVRTPRHEPLLADNAELRRPAATRSREEDARREGNARTGSG